MLLWLNINSTSAALKLIGRRLQARCGRLGVLPGGKTILLDGEGGQGSKSTTTCSIRRPFL